MPKLISQNLIPKQALSDLSILYRNKNILQSNENLLIFSLRIVNSGDISLKTNSFDENFPLGFKIDKGIFVETPNIIESTNDYITKSLKPKLDSTQQKVSFNRFIFDKDQNFLIKALILSKKGEIPEIIPTGKVADIAEIEILKKYYAFDNSSFNLLDMLVGAVLVYFAFYLWSSYTGKKYEKINQKIIDGFEKEYDITHPDKNILYEYFTSCRGLNFLLQLESMISNPQYVKYIKGLSTFQKNVEFYYSITGWQYKLPEFLRKLQDYEDKDKTQVSSEFKELVYQLKIYANSVVFPEEK
ncbi:hypothetical protein [Lewinella sp. W8]|uniref:hypothetical protein n=1 Tax=Lewinella sp. W8 TaxID=2528208 RepID=UPI001068A998|nr:hypothetical protein [Lewinella sp. W8]MTB53931.1 hypothetical protein [Lewinella sp. W8]